MLTVGLENPRSANLPPGQGAASVTAERDLRGLFSLVQTRTYTHSLSYRVMETLYYNMKSGLRLHIHRREVITSEELIQRVLELEEIQAQLFREQQGEAKPGTKASRPAFYVGNTYTSSDCCWYRHSIKDVVYIAAPLRRLVK